MCVEIHSTSLHFPISIVTKLQRIANSCKEVCVVFFRLLPWKVKYRYFVVLFFVICVFICIFGMRFIIVHL